MNIALLISRLPNAVFRLLREMVGFAVCRSGLSFAIRHTVCHRRATIIVYHDPKPVAFKSHLRYLKRRYNFVSLSDLVGAVRAGDWGMIPSRALALTLDDGHKANIDLVDLFDEMGVEPTIFLCSHIIDTNRHFWWNHAGFFAREFKRLPNEIAFNELEKISGFHAEKAHIERVTLNQKEILILQSRSEIGSHTKFHPILTNCEEDICWKEISQSKTRIETITREPVQHFSYPNGDHSPREEAMVATAGYLSGRTLDVGWVNANADPYRLKAMYIQDDASTNVLAAQVSGVYQFLHYLVCGSWNGSRPPRLE